ncbi:F-box domain cyclin-like protein [Neofusicoccum parvum]|uniref:F-box domain cyclin-like protein n=1 Tax=Neofusicoccum parvum TaxID=310453 RepID=A0ACB5RPC2_9PEZI|nr:F-box domain cyclin-like protein [Neofusicoccum parvum]
MLSEYSLRGLLDLSRHKDFGRAVTTLMIGTEQYEERYADPVLHKSWAALPQQQADAHAAVLEAQKRRRDRGDDCALLAQALANLPNCRAVEIVGNHVPARTAYRHHNESAEDLVYHSWGARTLADAVGLFPPTVSGREKGAVGHASHVFLTVLGAVAASAAPVSSLTMRVRYFQGVSGLALLLDGPHDRPGGIHRAYGTAFAPDHGAAVLERLRGSTRGLRSLALTLDALAVRSFDPASSRLGDRHLLAGLPALERLRLSAGYDVADAALHDVFARSAWLRGVRVLFLNDCRCQLLDIPSRILAHCPRLRKLTLAKVSTPEGYFPFFLHGAVQHPTLEVVRVTCIMEQGSWEGAGAWGKPAGVSPFVEKVRARDGSFRALECRRDAEDTADHVTWAVAATPGWGTTNVFQLRGEYDADAIRWPEEDLFDP